MSLISEILRHKSVYIIKRYLAPRFFIQSVIKKLVILIESRNNLRFYFHKIYLILFCDFYFLCLFPFNVIAFLIVLGRNLISRTEQMSILSIFIYVFVF